VTIGKHRRQVGHAGIPAQRGQWPVGIIDARTRVEHLVSDESARAHRDRGHYLALCGVTVLAASLTDPGRGRCRECAQ
jgi:hypothetical protein